MISGPAWNGRRVYPHNSDGTYHFELLKPRDYWMTRSKAGEAQWSAITPTGMHCSLWGHKVTEDSQGRITVWPSILVKSYDGPHVKEEWHGFLTGGVWTLEPPGS